MDPMGFRKRKSLDLEVGTFSIQSYVVEIKELCASHTPVVCLHDPPKTCDMKPCIAGRNVGSNVLLTWSFLPLTDWGGNIFQGSNE